jgi:uncharacterized membrane protein YfcA
MNDTFLLTLLIFTAALLYSSVGHAGASGYLAAMALFNLAPDVMKPTALVLNLVVATVGTIRFAQAGCFSWQVFWPFAVLSVPLAFVGGAMTLSNPAYKTMLGLVLLFAAGRLAFPIAGVTNTTSKPVVLPLALGFGGVIGLLAGLTGVGGGIFLSPLLLFLGWADVRRTAGVSVAFILVNSVSGLLGHLASVKHIPSEIIWWAPAALLGGVIGAELGSRRLALLTMRRLLAAVLVVAAVGSFWPRKATPSLVPSQRSSSVDSARTTT